MSDRTTGTGGAPHFDLAVVGAGAVGSLTAYYAVRRDPGRRVAVITHAGRGAGATRLSAGFDTPTGHNPAQRALAARSTALFAELAAALGDAGRAPVDVRWLVARENAAALDATMADGGRTRPVTAEQRSLLERTFPGLAHGDAEVLLASAPMTAGQPQWLADRLLDEVLGRPGNTLLEGFRVTGVRRTDGRLELAAADGSRITADQAVLAPGPWALDGPLAAAARARGARVKKVVAFHVMAPPPPGAPALVLEDADAFLLPHHPGGHWILSITSPDWDRGPDGPLAIDARDRELARTLLARHVPGFLPHLLGGRVFSDCFTPGHLPVVDTAGDDDVVMAIGGSGSGYRLAPAMAEDALNLLDWRTRS
ncbi:FAD-binding oxidoreductase [Streptomyces sp. WAC07061]|uniref:NAD(P)/FAD-dependent oxidoreductase n=1 Tax=Streptomyces sp. WAC07061 TaxID=2487410 RepID=UPI000F7A1DA0|nr:FAD-binding oxidoreductase [Streptomyces sp. WAC07061]RSS49935.1 FAD-binding oxidoreductase [Streptomyces sp. WAC07061]